MANRLQTRALCFELSVCHWCAALTPPELQHNIILQDNFSGTLADSSSLYKEDVENVYFQSIYKKSKFYRYNLKK